MGLIVIHIDSQKDTNFLTKCYEGIEDAKVLVNPTRAKIDKTLTDNPNDKVMMLGHGSSYGLFGTNWQNNAIDARNAKLLKDRECIGIWCYAKNFARNYGLKGYFTSMFISNGGEAKCYKYDATEEDVFNEVALFAERINTLYKEDVPLNEWVAKLQEQADYSKGYVEFNYSNMEYFDGTQKPDYKPYNPYDWYDDEDDSYFGHGRYFDGTYNKGNNTAKAVSRDWNIDDEFDLWFDDYCKEHGIEGDWARDIAEPIFKAGWDAHGDALAF